MKGQEIAPVEVSGIYDIQKNPDKNLKIESKLAANDYASNSDENIFEEYSESLILSENIAQKEIKENNAPMKNFCTSDSIDNAKQTANMKLLQLEKFSENKSMIIKSYRYSVLNFSRDIFNVLQDRKSEENDELEKFVSDLEKLTEIKNHPEWIRKIVGAGISIDYALPVPGNQKIFELVMDIIQENDWGQKGWSTSHAISHFLRQGYSHLLKLLAPS